MSVRLRLTKYEVNSLGLEWREGDGGRNPKYRLKKDKVNELYKIRGVEKGAKVLIFDIETAPSVGYIWGKWQQNIHDGQLINEWFMLTWSAKWLFHDEVLNAKLTGKEALKQNDKRIAKSIWKLLDEADILIGHNIKKFDLKKLNARFLLHGLGTPSSFELIDTLLHARKSFSVHSNKLDYLAQILGVGSKVNHDGFSMWDKCYKGDEESLAKMAEYNDGDILINESVYLEIRPFIKPHPNLGLYIGDDIERCPSCGSDDLKVTGDYYTTTNSYPELTCGNCGSNSRSRKANKRGSGVLSSLPR